MDNILVLNQKNEMNTVVKGDIVQLRSGGPNMTVTSVSLNGVIGCLWFDETNRICKDGFRSDLLYIVEKPSFRMRPQPESLEVSCSGVV